MKQSEQIGDLITALAKAQAQFPAVGKSGVNPHFKSRFLTMDDLVDATRPALLAHGLVMLQSTADEDESGLTVETMLAHVSGQWIVGRVRMPLEKPSPQAAGSAITYGKRYGLAALLGVVADEDDDGNAAQAAAPAPRRDAPPRPAPASSGAEPVMPFGKTKGTPLSQMATDDLQGAVDWAISKDKFREFQAEARAELEGRRFGTSALAAKPGDDEPPLDDEAPF